MAKVNVSEALEQYERDGYVCFRGLVSPSLCEEIKGNLLQAFERASATFSSEKLGGLLHGHLNAFPGARSKAVAQDLEDEGVLAFMEAATGRAHVLSSAGCNMNLPGSRSQNFHIDGQWDTPWMIANITLVPTTALNGATEVSPGTHKEPMRYWRFFTSGGKARSVALVAEPGDVVIRPSRLWHRGVANRSTAIRPMLNFLYEPVREGVTVMDWSRDNGEVAFQSNRYETDMKGRVAELLATHADPLMTGLRFVKSMVA